VILGCSAALFGILAVPLVALGKVEFPTFDLFGGDNETRTTSSTLGPLPAVQCAALRSVRDAGNAAFAATFNGSPAVPWPADRATTDGLLARYEFTLQSARADVPPQIAGELEQVAQHVHAGRAILARAASRKAYVDAVTGEVLGGFAELNRADETLGSACGEHFTFWPRGTT
jgi:hypothetical protein